MQLHKTAAFDLTVPEPFDFRLTVSKPAGWHWSTPGEIFDKGVLWTGLYLSGTPVGLKMSAVKNLVKVDVFTTTILKPEDISELKMTLGAGLGGDEDLAGFYRFAGRDKVLSQTVKDIYGMRVGRLDDLFGRVLLAILLQMAPLARSEQMMSAVLDGYGTKLRFDGKNVILWPAPEDIVKAGEGELRARAKVGYRAKRLVQAADFIIKTRMSLFELAKMDEAEALKRLTGIPGIGRYSAGIILGKTTVPVDVWSVVVMSELFLGNTPGKPRGDVDKVGSLLEKRWGKWSWLAFVYVLNDLENLAKTHRLSRLQ